MKRKDIVGDYVYYRDNRKITIRIDYLYTTRGGTNVHTCVFKDETNNKVVVKKKSLTAIKKMLEYNRHVTKIDTFKPTRTTITHKLTN